MCSKDSSYFYVAYIKCKVNLPNVLVFKKWFGKYFRNLFLCANIFKLDILFGDLLSDKMIFNQNVLRIGMHHRILGDTGGAGVIAKDGNRLIKLDLNILQSLLHPENFCTTSYYHDIFFFCCG